MQSILGGLDAPGAGDVHATSPISDPRRSRTPGTSCFSSSTGSGRPSSSSDRRRRCAASLRGTMTSVFPSTTATAVTTFLTGLAPVEHAVTGWFTWLRELDSVIAPLPFTTRAGGTDLTALGVSPADVFVGPSVFERVRADCHTVLPAELVDSSYSQLHMRGAAPQGFRGARCAGRLDSRHRPSCPSPHLHLRLLARARRRVARIRRVERPGPASPRGDRSALRVPARCARRNGHAARGDRGPRLRRHSP